MVTDSNELLGQALGTCTLQRLLGRGGMGAVYLARQSRPRRIVAVKVLLPGIVLEQRSRHEFLARFRREADAIAALDHINIMPVYEYGEQGDIAFLVMPYVTGGTLRDVLEKRSVLSLEEVVPIIEQAAAGLDCAHAQTIVHRDLKPGNILFHADGRIVLADFGLAKVLKDVTDHESSQGHLTSVGTIVGTPEYLSPEQGTGDTIDYRTDVYSLGVVLYQMLAGRVPFTGTSPVAVAIKHTLEQPPPITRFNPQVPKNVEAVVMKAMAKSPGDRFNSAGMFAQALRQAVSEALGDHFPSSLPATAGEQFTPIYPLTQEKMTGTPPERHTEDDELPTKITYPSNNEPQENGTPTVLMEDESHNNKTEAAPRLSEGTQDRLQALPTVITGLDATIADQPAPAARNVPLAQPPIQETAREQAPKEYPPAAQIRPRQPITNPPVAEQSALEQSNRKQESERSTQWDNVRSVQQQQMQGYPTRQSTPPRSRVSSTRIPRIIALAIAILAIIIIAGSVATFLINQNSHTSTRSNTITANAAATSTAASNQKSTPVPQTTPKSTLNPTTPLPQALAPGAGSLIYGTNYPGTCDPKGGTWQMINIQAQCGPAQLELTNPTSSDAGAILTQLPNGASLPSSYYIQVQVTLNTPNSSFGIYYHWSSSAYHIVTFNANTWDSFFETQELLQYGPVALNGVTLAKMVTVDVLVNQGDFTYYINNIKQGTSSSTNTGIDTGGNIGLTVGQNSDVSFKNLAIYNLQ